MGDYFGTQGTVSIEACVLADPTPDIFWNSTRWNGSDGTNHRWDGAFGK
jgi:hypothetical protein